MRVLGRGVRPRPDYPPARLRQPSAAVRQGCVRRRGNVAPQGPTGVRTRTWPASAGCLRSADGSDPRSGSRTDAAVVDLRRRRRRDHTGDRQWPVADRGIPATRCGDDARTRRATGAVSAMFNGTGQPRCRAVGADGDGLPTAIQIVGRPFGEATLLSLAAQIEKVRPMDASKAAGPLAECLPPHRQFVGVAHRLGGACRRQPAVAQRPVDPGEADEVLLCRRTVEEDAIDRGMCVEEASNRWPPCCPVRSQNRGCPVFGTAGAHPRPRCHTRAARRCGLRDRIRIEPDDVAGDPPNPLRGLP